MSLWIIAGIVAGVAALGVVFALLIFRLDAQVEEELQLGDGDRSWTSII